MRAFVILDTLSTIDQIERFLDGSEICHYKTLSNKDERYQWIQKTLVQFRYLTLSKRDKGVVIRLLIKISGYSRQQLTRLIKQYVQTGRCVRSQRTANGFSTRYTRQDTLLLVDMDQLHETPCGAVIKKYCERAWQAGDLRYERLAGISVAHIYNLRKSDLYQSKRRQFTKTQSRSVSIGERRKPKSNGIPGYLRVDTVHQGDQDGKKGVYHVNLVDEQTHFEAFFAVEGISEQFMIPGLISSMALLPFKIRGFHSDNGSEFINKDVAKLLDKLRIEFTKSRARKSNDNALVESKNGSVIRKHFGYSHIPQHWANEINRVMQEPLYRYVNFHRPCFFPEAIVNEKGKQQKSYPYENLMTPSEKLLLTPNLEQHLKPERSIATLKAYGAEMSDEQAARQLQEVKQKLFSKIFKTPAA